MDKTYLKERQIEYWTSRQIEDFLLNEGFDVFVNPIPQSLEKLLPADFVFQSTKLKLFGFQYKALYHNSADHWKLSNQQHQTLQAFDWIYYGLSEMTSIKQSRNSLYYLLIRDTSMPFIKKYELSSAYNSVYSRWGAFYKGLKNCTKGVRIKSSGDLREKVNPNKESDLDGFARDMIDIFLTDFNNNKVYKYSSFIESNEE